VQGIAKWLVARPLNAVLALAATSSPYLGFLSSVLIVLFVLRQGLRLAIFEALMAGTLMAVVSIAVGTPASVVIAVAIVFWLPAMLLASVLSATRSLTLTLQMSVLMTVLGMVAFFIAVGDPAAFWEVELQAAAEVWRNLGANDLADSLADGGEVLASQMTMFIVVTLWSIYAATFVLGYRLFRLLPGEMPQCGRFRDLNFGRVVALMMAVSSVVALLGNAAWLQNIAFVLFAVFWLQGLAIVHWLHGKEILPAFGVVMVYVLMLPLSAVVVVALAVLGYIDAWFRLRERGPAASTGN
jgi:hypothetical protein